jgi:hypothetical protein
MVGACSTHGKDEKRIEYFGLENRKGPGKHRRRWEDNIRMDLRDIG